MVGQAFSFDGTNGYVRFPTRRFSTRPILPSNAGCGLLRWTPRFRAVPQQGEQFIVFKQNSRTSNFEGFDLSKIRVAGA